MSFLLQTSLIIATRRHTLHVQAPCFFGIHMILMMAVACWGTPKIAGLAPLHHSKSGSLGPVNHTYASRSCTKCLHCMPCFYFGIVRVASLDRFRVRTINSRRYHSMVTMAFCRLDFCVDLLIFQLDTAL